MRRGMPAEHREEIREEMPERPERGERRAGRRAMKGPGRLEEGTEERTKETAVERVREDGWPKRGWNAAIG